MSDYAFPQPHEWTTGGLTKREYFAAKAMQGYIASHTGEFRPSAEDAAQSAVLYADELIQALNKKQP